MSWPCWTKRTERLWSSRLSFYSHAKSFFFMFFIVGCSCDVTIDRNLNLKLCLWRVPFVSYFRILNEVLSGFGWWCCCCLRLYMMYMGDTESCSSRVCNSWWNQNRKQRQKVEVYNEVLSRLRELNVPEATVPGFEEELWAHFYRLPTRYIEPQVLTIFQSWYVCVLSQENSREKKRAACSMWWCGFLFSHFS